jgi:hypothetical protein
MLSHPFGGLRVLFHVDVGVCDAELLQVPQSILRVVTPARPVNFNFHIVPLEII